MNSIVIFHSYVSLPEGIWTLHPQFFWVKFPFVCRTCVHWTLTVGAHPSAQGPLTVNSQHQLSPSLSLYIYICIYVIYVYYVYTICFQYLHVILDACGLICPNITDFHKYLHVYIYISTLYLIRQVSRWKYPRISWRSTPLMARAHDGPG
jgi:hypothetical protein